MRIQPLLFLLTFALSVTAARAQQKPTATIDDLSAPQSPAFVLLGVSPADVERPDTPKAFALNLLDKVTTANGLPRNYALSVAPYWLTSHRNLEFEEYQNPSIKQSILQTFLLSVGTVPIAGVTSSAAPIGTRIGLGGRAAIFNGRANPRLQPAIEKRLEPLDDEILDRAQEVAELEKAIEKNPKDAESLMQLEAARKALAAARERATSVALDLQALDAERVGFFLTIAGGQAWSVLDDDTRNVKAEQRGFWVTPSYRWRGCSDTADCESSFDAIAVVRVLKEPVKDSVVDYGARAVWKVTKQFSASVEALRRNAGDDSLDDDSNRTVGLLEYRIRQDLILFGVFGKDFKDITGTKPLVSLLGLNLGFGKKAVINAR